MAIGLDIGTNSIISSKQKDGKIVSSFQRDAFLDLVADDSTKRILEQVGANFIVHGDKVLVIGEESLILANTFRQEVRRPMAKGVISNKDSLARDVLCEIIKILVGKPEGDNDHVFYTVPASPLNIEDFDITYHSEVMNETLARLGFKPHPINEALCIVYKEAADNRFTALGISVGAGANNVCLANLGIVNKNATFSIAGMGGDWIDKQVSNRRAGLTASKVTKIKEDQKNPIDLIKDDGNSDIVRDAICKYYRVMIRNLLENIKCQFSDIGFDFEDTLPIIIGGGGCKIAGFKEVFEQELEKVKVPFKIKDIRIAKDPLYAISQGALVRALLEKS